MKQFITIDQYYQISEKSRIKYQELWGSILSRNYVSIGQMIDFLLKEENEWVHLFLYNGRKLPIDYHKEHEVVDVLWKEVKTILEKIA